MNVLSSLVTQIRIESALTPAITINQPFADSPPSPVASVIGHILKPVVITTVAGREYRSAPYGEPGEAQWITLAAVAAVAGLAWAAWKARR